MKLSEFDYDLPKRLIAQKPLEERSSSKLFFYDREKGKGDHRIFRDIVSEFGPNDILVLNNSRVIPARIAFEGKEILLVEPLKNEADSWKCMVRRGKYFQEGSQFEFSDGTIATVEKMHDDGLRSIRFHSSNFKHFLQENGEMPLPPYIHEKCQNPEQYQTVYSQEEGSVAAPTAGFHFTPKLLKELEEKGVQIEYVTLHVGLGTFLPVKTEDIEDHDMHEEWYSISKNTAERLVNAREQGKKITAVGTTSLRTLESFIQTRQRFASTKLFITPPYTFQFVDHLITNFHLPKSTLLMLLAAFLSPKEIDGIEKMHELYREAISNEYRFYSFGDSMCIW